MSTVPVRSSRPATSRPGSARTGTVWWLSPVAVTLLVVSAATLSTALISDDVFRMQWRTPKTITTTTCMLLLAGGLALALGAALVISARPPRPRAGRWPALSAAEVHVLNRASTPLFVLTLIGYAAFVVTGARSGISLSQLAAAFGSEGVYGGDIKQTVGTVPGVTTLTQAGIASVVVSALLLAQSPSRRQWARLAVVLALALPRAFLLTERLAVLELIVPVLVVFALWAAGSPRGHRAAATLPLMFLPFVVVVFGAFEYFRSWVFFRSQSNGTFAEFAIERLVGYYATALNNGALEIAYNRFPGRWPYETMAAFWSAPGISSLNLYRTITGYDNAEVYLDILKNHGTPEFNNSSGLAAPFVDFGTAGGLLYLLAAGVLIGLLYCGFRESSPMGLLIYPVLFIGVVELPRYLAWSQGRVFPALVMLVALAVLLRRARAGAGAQS